MHSQKTAGGKTAVSGKTAAGKKPAAKNGSAPPRRRT